MKKVEKEIYKIENNINKLIDLHLEGILDKASFEVKHIELIQELEKVKFNEKEIQEAVNKEGDLQDRINTFRKLFEDNEFLEKFDREIFESVIDKIIVGKIDENGDVNPYSITFVFKTGLEIEKKDIKDNLYLYPLHDPS